MRKRRFTDKQIIKVLKEPLPGCRGAICAEVRHQRCDVLQVAIPIWRDGDIRGAQAEGAPEDENRKLKKPLAETMLDASTLKDARKNF